MSQPLEVGVKHLASDPDVSLFMESPGNKVLLYTASWCGPGRPMEAMLSGSGEVATYLGRKQVKVAIADSDITVQSATSHGIIAVPTMLAYNGAERKGFILGNCPEGVVVATLRQYFDQ